MLRRVPQLAFLLTLLTVACPGCVTEGAKAEGSNSVADQAPSSTSRSLTIDAGAHLGVITALTFSPDNHLLYSISHDKTVRVWSVSNRSPLGVLRPPTGLGERGKLYAGALSPDGQLLAVGGFGIDYPADHRIIIISLPTRRIIHVKGHTDAINDLRFSPDGEKLASGSFDGTARIWDVRELRSALARSPDPKVPEAEAWIEPNRVPMRTLGSRVSSVAFSPDGSSLLIGTVDANVAIWAFSKDAENLRNVQSESSSGALAWNPDGSSFAVATRTGVVQTFRPDGSLLQSQQVWSENIGSLVYSSFCGLLVANDDRITILDSSTLEIRHTFARRDSSITAVGVSNDCELLAAGDYSGHIYLWSLKTNLYVGQLGANWPHPTRKLAWSKTGKVLSWTSRAGDARAGFDFETFTPQSPSTVPWSAPILEYRNGTVQKVDERRLIVSWSPLPSKAGKSPEEKPYEIALLSNDADRIESFGYFDSLIAVGTRWRLYLYDPQERRKVRGLLGHLQAVKELAGTSDGKILASAGDDPFIFLWDANSHEPLLTFMELGDGWLAWSPSGYYASSGSPNVTVGWQIDKGYGRLADFIAAKPEDGLDRQDVLREVVARGNLELALKQLDLQDPRLGNATSPTPNAEAMPAAPRYLSDHVAIYRRIEERQRAVGMQPPDPLEVLRQLQVISKQVGAELGKPPGKPLDATDIILKSFYSSEVPTRYENPVVLSLSRDLMRQIVDAAYDHGLELRHPPRIATMTLRNLDAYTERYESLDDHVIYTDPLLFYYINTANKAVLTILNEGLQSKKSFGVKELDEWIKQRTDLREEFSGALAEILGLSKMLRASSRIPIPTGPVSELTEEAELFIIAHEYVHASYRHRGSRNSIAAGLDTDSSAADARLRRYLARRWKDELFADFVGAELALSAIYRNKDRLRGLEGAGLNLYFTYMQIAEEAQRIAKNEKETEIAAKEDSSFPLKMLQAIVQDGAEADATLAAAGSREVFVRWAQRQHPPSAIRLHFVKRQDAPGWHSGSAMNNFYIYIALSLWKACKDEFTRAYALNAANDR
jgi:WD40 repeat protein